MLQLQLLLVEHLKSKYIFRIHKTYEAFGQTRVLTHTRRLARAHTHTHKTSHTNKRC